MLGLRPTDADHDAIQNLIEMAYRKVGPGFVRERINSTDPDLYQDFQGGVYLSVSVMELRKEKGPIPAGTVVRLHELVPQHHDQDWVNDKMVPALSRMFLRVWEERPETRDRMMMALLPATLVPFYVASHFAPEFGVYTDGRKESAFVYGHMDRTVKLIRSDPRVFGR